MAKQPSLDDFRVPYCTREKEAAAFARCVRPGREAVLVRFEGRRPRTAVGRVDRADVQQERLHTQQKKRVLLVLQGMDTSGKDGTVRAVFREVDPLGLRVVSFKAPTPIEAAHDFLWRVHAGAGAGEPRSSTAATMKTCSCRACST